MTTKKQNNSLFLYTALIFIMAIVLIILAFFGQTHLEMSQPSATASPTTEATSQPQGIQKTASELSQKNLELLEENRVLNKNIDELEKTNEVYEKLITANSYANLENKEAANDVLKDINYDTLNSDCKSLYDEIMKKIQ